MIAALRGRLALLALVLLAGYGSAAASGEAARRGPSTMAQAPTPPGGTEIPGGHPSRTGWAFEVRDDQTAPPVWVGAWTTERCEELRAGFAGASRLPSRRVGECRRLVFTAERGVRQVWAVSSEGGFVASANEAKCDQTVALIMRNQQRPPCAPEWVTFP